MKNENWKSQNNLHFLDNKRMIIKMLPQSGRTDRRISQNQRTYASYEIEATTENSRITAAIQSLSRLVETIKWHFDLLGYWKIFKIFINPKWQNVIRERAQNVICDRGKMEKENKKLKKKQKQKPKSFHKHVCVLWRINGGNVYYVYSLSFSYQRE